MILLGPALVSLTPLLGVFLVFFLFLAILPRPPNGGFHYDSQSLKNIYIEIIHWHRIVSKAGEPAITTGIAAFKCIAL